jgi:N-acyl-D-aspartate/D-glutamate deacylase
LSPSQLNQGQGRCELKVTNALVIDGTGSPGFRGDVAVESGRIIAVGALGGWKSDAVIDADSMVLAPGFIDVHTHDDVEVLKNPSMDCKVSQGVTTVIAGNCGISIAPVSHSGNMPAPFPILGQPEEFRYSTIGAYKDGFEKSAPAVNLALLIGHSSLRLTVMKGSLERPATASEITEMSKLLDHGLKSGCIGLSSGLDYPPALEAPESELVALASVLRENPSTVYTTHMRDEGDGVIEAVKETLRTGRKAKVPVIISHHKCAGPKNYGRSRQTLKLIESAQNGQDVGLDVYPYVASSTSLIPRFIRDAEKVLVAYSEPYPQMASRPLDEIASSWRCSLEEAAQRLYPAGAIYFQMDEADVSRILAFPGTMVGSDGLPSMSHPHPRLWGTFPRVLAHYVREQKLLSLEQAVHKMTGLSARTFGLNQRGNIKEGYKADLVLFDPDRIKDTATFQDPVQPARGIHHVFVNGVPVWSNGRATGQRSGMFLTPGDG